MGNYYKSIDIKIKKKKKNLQKMLTPIKKQQACLRQKVCKSFPNVLTTSYIKLSLLMLYKFMLI